MGDTLNINLAGMLFRIEIKAYEALRNYLQVINIRFGAESGGNETMADIELRIAEIFNSQKGAKEVVTLENVEAMISIIGAPVDFAQYEENEPSSAKRKRLYRNPDNKIIAGICGGLGAYLNIDPVIIRVLFAVFTIFYGAGFLVYLILWIAILPANNQERQRELHGGEYRKANYDNPDGIGVAVNEMFTTTKNVLYAIMRVCLIFAGIMFVTTGFMFLLSFLFLFFFKVPEAFLPDTLKISLAYLPDFIKLIITPPLYPWIMILSAIVVLLPLMALIYWGVKMIFWFKAKDGILSMSLFIIWILSATMLGLLMFAEGISFADRSVASEKTPIQNSSDTIYIAAKNKISDIESYNMLPFRASNYYMLIDNENRELHISSEFIIRRSDSDSESITVRKSAHASNGAIAFDKAQKIDYNYEIIGDTIYIDDYFTITSNRKWAAENVMVSIELAKGKVIKVDDSIDKLLYNRNMLFNNRNISYPRKRNDGYSYWIITDRREAVPLRMDN